MRRVSRAKSKTEVLVCNKMERCNLTYIEVLQAIKIDRLLLKEWRIFQAKIYKKSSRKTFLGKDHLHRSKVKIVRVCFKRIRWWFKTKKITRVLKFNLEPRHVCLETKWLCKEILRMGNKRSQKYKTQKLILKLTV